MLHVQVKVALTFDSGRNLHGYCVTKATEHYFPVVLFIMFINLYKVDLTLKLITSRCAHSNKQYWAYFYFSVVLFVVPYKVALTFESVDEILTWDQSYLAVLSCGADYCAEQQPISMTI